MAASATLRLSWQKTLLIKKECNVFVRKHHSSAEAVVRRFSVKKVISKYFTKFTGKHLCWSLFLIFAKYSRIRRLHISPWDWDKMVAKKGLNMLYTIGELTFQGIGETMSPRLNMSRSTVTALLCRDTLLQIYNFWKILIVDYTKIYMSICKHYQHNFCLTWRRQES